MLSEQRAQVYSGIPPSSRVQKSSSAKSRELLFLHNTPERMFDSQNSHNRDPTTLRKLRKHVQDHQRRQRLQVVGSTAPLGWQPKLSSTRLTAECERDIGAIQTSASVTQAIAATTENSHQGSVDARSSQESFQRLKPLGLPYIPEPGRAGIDDFSLLLERLDPHSYRIVQHFIHGFLPLGTSFYKQALSSYDVGTWEEKTADLIRGCFSSKMHFSVLMTTACASMKSHFGYRFHTPDTPAKYMNASVSSLRQYLSENGPVTDQLMMTLFCIGASEGWLGNDHGAWVHFQAFSRLCNTHLGGYRNVNPVLRAMIMYTSRLMAAHLGKPAVCEDIGEAPSCYEEQRLLKSLTNLCNTTLLTGSDFHSGLEDLDSVLQQNFTKILSLSRRRQFVLYGYKLILPTSHEDIGKSQRLSDDLLSLPHHVIAGMSARQNSVRFAVAIWLCYTEILTTVPSEAAELEAKISIRTTLQSLRSHFARFLLTAQSQLQADRNVHQGSNCASYRGRVGHVVAQDESTACAICSGQNEQRCSQECNIGPCHICRSRTDEGVTKASDTDSSLQPIRLCMWIAAIGVFASEADQDRAWFENHFKHLASTLEIHSWTVFANLAQRFMFLDHIEQASQMRISTLLTLPSPALTEEPIQTPSLEKSLCNNTPRGQQDDGNDERQEANRGLGCCKF